MPSSSAICHGRPMGLHVPYAINNPSETVLADQSMAGYAQDSSSPPISAGLFTRAGLITVPNHIGAVSVNVSTLRMAAIGGAAESYGTGWGPPVPTAPDAILGVFAVWLIDPLLPDNDTSYTRPYQATLLFHPYGFTAPWDDSGTLYVNAAGITSSAESPVPHFAGSVQPANIPAGDYAVISYSAVLMNASPPPPQYHFIMSGTVDATLTFRYDTEVHSHDACATSTPAVFFDSTGGPHHSSDLCPPH